MPFQQEEEKSGLERQLSKEAIDLAIQGRWEEAVIANRNIIVKFPTDADAYNRLGRALTELGEFAQAREAYAKTLELAPNNAIAKKNLARLASLSEFKATSHRGHHKVAPELFITEVGKMGVVNLCNLAPRGILAKMGLGDEVHLSVKGQRLIVQSEQREYLGEVEPKHGLRLIKLMEGGNEYAAAVFGIGEGEMKVVIKEIYQHPSQVGRISFPIEAAERFGEEALVRYDVIADEGGAPEGVESSEERGGYEEGEAETLPEGFSVLEETDEKAELEP
jgi:tetratricopeptide (TPR) repeat protein